MCSNSKFQTGSGSILMKEFLSPISQKRIKLISNIKDYFNEDLTDDIDIKNLKQIVRICQTEYGIMDIEYQNVEKYARKYIVKRYCKKRQQFLATSILCNLYVISRPLQPSKQFTDQIMNIIQHGDIDGSSNFVALVFNIAYDHSNWAQKILRQYRFSEVLCQKLKHQKLARQGTINILRTLTKILNKSKPEHSLRLFFCQIVKIIQTNTQKDSQLAIYGFICLRQLDLMFSKELTNYFNEKMLDKLFFINKQLPNFKIINFTVQVIHMALENVCLSWFEENAFPVILSAITFVIDQSEVTKQLVYSILAEALQKEKLSELR